MTDVICLGIDGCRGGWFFVQLDDSGDFAIGIMPALKALRESIMASALTLIDIPIGLKSRGGEERQCDRMARRLLGPRASSVFPAPCRQALACTDYASGSAVNQAVTGRRLSRQSWAIVPKIAEADALMRSLPQRSKLREMHPELCFWAFNDAHPMAHNKKGAAGHEERFALLAGLLPQTPAIEKQARATWKKRELADDDILDAIAGALTARHAAALKSLPPEPERDEEGLRMEIVYVPRGAL